MYMQPLANDARPFGSAPATPRDKPQEITMLSRQFRILVVEDDDGHASLVRRNLIRSGVANEIMRARNGREALELIRTQRRSAKRESNVSLLLLLDLNMPVIDGLGVLDTVKANHDTAEIPVIMLTTTDDPREIERCYAAGCSLYISKPVEYEKFVEVIGRLGGFLQVISVPTGGAIAPPPSH